MLFRLFFSSKIENLHHFMHKNTPKTSSNIGSEMFITRPSLITKKHNQRKRKNPYPTSQTRLKSKADKKNSQKYGIKT